MNGAELRRMIISAAASIEIHKQALNELNVFPVPDGDTGTNMSMTIASAASIEPTRPFVSTMPSACNVLSIFISSLNVCLFD